MAGFFLQVFQSNAPRDPRPVRLFDLGACEIDGCFERGPVRAAWSYWEGSKQWRVIPTPGRLLLIEGRPDRFPAEFESAAAWIQGRTGSFRGFEVTFDPADPSAPPRVAVFVDPVAAQSLFCIAGSASVSFADKLATLAINTDSPLEPHWPGILEAGVFASLYSPETTVQGAELLSPGAFLEVREGRIVSRRRYRMPVAAADPMRSRREPVEALRESLAGAVNAVWDDPDTYLLLSGGMDSRSTLVAATGPRKTFTLNLYPEETRIAAQVAKACGATHAVFEVPPDHYEHVLNHAYLLTGAMHWPRSAHPLGLPELWRKLGIRGVCHGWPYNTFFRGWVARPYQKYPLRSSALFDWIGPKAYYFENFASNYPGTFDRFVSLLSADGKDALRGQLRKLARDLDVVVVNGVDVTFERRLLSELSRQVYASTFASWTEGVDIASPALDPAIWSWYEASAPEHRTYDRLYRDMLLSSNHPAFELPDSNTNRKLEHLPALWQDRVRNRAWYPLARSVYLKLFHKQEPSTEFFPANLSIGTLQEALGRLESNPLIAREALGQALRRYREGGVEWLDVLWAFGAAGQWIGLLGQANRFISPFARSISSTPPAPQPR
jgi:hypothetical protein